jgi:hypothetical protein
MGDPDFPTSSSSWPGHWLRPWIQISPVYDLLVHVGPWSQTQAFQLKSSCCPGHGLWIEMVTAADRVIDMDSGFTTEKVQDDRVAGLDPGFKFCRSKPRGLELASKSMDAGFLT